MSQAGRIQCWAEQAGISPEGYEQTFHKAATAEGIAENPNTNARLIAYLQDYTSSTSTSLPELQAATALQLGVSSWDNVGYNLFTGSPGFGPELIVNGGFDANLNNWTVGSSVRWVFLSGNGGAIIDEPASPAAGTIEQDVSLTSGTEYQITTGIAVFTSGSVQVIINGSVLGTVTTTGAYEYTWTAPSTGTFTVEIIGANGFQYIVDDVSLRAVL